MVREIVHDPMLLAGKSVPATQADKQIITDLMDTLKAHLGCLSLLGGPRKTTRYEELASCIRSNPLFFSFFLL